MFGLQDDIGILRSSGVHILKHGAISVSVVECTESVSYDLTCGIKIALQ